MNIIVAVDEKWGIGKNNDLLFHLKKDMQYFKEKTTGKIVVMGSNTLLSFPQSKPLPNRTNIVLWPGGAERSDCIVVQSLSELAKTLKNYPSDDIFIVGGAMFYRTMLPYCRKAYITHVQADGNAAVFFPDLSRLVDWRLQEKGDPIQDGENTIQFCVYENSNVQSMENC